VSSDHYKHSTKVLCQNLVKSVILKVRSNDNMTVATGDNE